MRIVPRTAVITGAPGAGKTTLIAALAARGWRTVREAARAILALPDGMALRADDPIGFAEAMIAHEIAELEAAPADGTWTVFDRGIGDSLGFLRLSGLEPSSEMIGRAASLRYSGPIFDAPAWADIYRPDSQRIQTWDEAIASGRAVAAAWRDIGYRLTELPFAAPELRADFVAARLSA